MSTGRYILSSTLILSWAMIMSFRCLAAAVFNIDPAGSYSYGISAIGWFLPFCAWVALIAGVLIAWQPPFLSRIARNQEDEQSDKQQD